LKIERLRDVFFKEMNSLQEIDFWTSGTDTACKGVNFWASTNKKISNQKMAWTSAISGDCIGVQYLNGSSKFSKLSCAKELNFICEVALQLLLLKSTLKQQYINI
jgi:hypothetical protein